MSGGVLFFFGGGGKILGGGKGRQNLVEVIYPCFYIFFGSPKTIYSMVFQDHGFSRDLYAINNSRKLLF